MKGLSEGGWEGLSEGGLLSEQADPPPTWQQKGSASFW